MDFDQYYTLALKQHMIRYGHLALKHKPPLLVPTLHVESLGIVDQTMTAEITTSSFTLGSSQPKGKPYKITRLFLISLNTEVIQSSPVADRRPHRPTANRRYARVLQAGQKRETIFAYHCHIQYSAQARIQKPYMYTQPRGTPQTP